MSTNEKDKVLKWEYAKYTPTETLPAIHVETDRHKKKVFYQTIGYLLKLLWNDGIRLINYDHVSFFIPKANLPLKWKHEHFCISFIDHRGNLILLYMKVIPPKNQTKKVRKELWRRRKS